MDEEEIWDFDSDPDSIAFDRDRHIRYLEMMYDLIPSPYEGQEINRLTLAYFVISGLDILQALDRVSNTSLLFSQNNFNIMFTWKYLFTAGEFYGFHGSRSSQFRSNDNGTDIPNGSHMAATYCALTILKTVGFDFSLFDSELLLKSMKNLQQPNGCFMPIHTGAETDLRFVFCAAAICSMLKSWSGMDREKAKEYILSCQSYDGGFGLVPGSESHGGATYCAVASLQLMAFLEEGLLSKNASGHIINVPLLLDWLLQRQAEDGGFQGRANKPTDTCYAFWVGGILRILGADKFINKTALHGFLLTCQSEYGGFSKFPRLLPDLYHSYYGLCAFSLLKEPGLNALCVELGITDITAIGI
ncbi:hypothetical protein RD792_009722 [Penstemon davidsonii]|uniref:Prenyltransferase alpha-alpha toroid domain-containing protein n=1 Tax=Penstemon davidsonii TaxID=160366 RepID=A0ABR0CZW2_9LAMI|nr:hypothetical protein RD792_009722 [Penstemon davidsonii]